MRKWKEQLLGGVDMENIGGTLFLFCPYLILKKWFEYWNLVKSETHEPEVKILNLSIIAPDREDIVLSVPEDGKPKGLWFTLKEGSRYSLKFSFEVKNNIVSGLRYINTVWKTGVKGKTKPQYNNINDIFIIFKFWQMHVVWLQLTAPNRCSEPSVHNRRRTLSTRLKKPLRLACSPEEPILLKLRWSNLTSHFHSLNHIGINVIRFAVYWWWQ